ncbi:MAG TPA: hypothetical protein VFG20_02670 [Planctomycetaceae bacterium]|nr:hypothetical protein [Planctomycetaceae bacterium]
MLRRHLSTAMPSSVSAWLARGAAVLALSCGACATTSVTQQTLPNRELANAGVTRVQRAPAMRDRAIQQVAYQDALGPNCPPEAITSCPPDPRMPLGGPMPYGVGMPICDAACQPSPHHYPDEYLCDGGDREWPVHYYEDERHGLDTEDTVAEFTDHKGKERTSKSNKVCVYSPRFASVRTVSLPHEEGTIVEVAKAENTTGGNEVRTRMAATLRNKNVAVGGVAMRSRASGLEGEVVQDTKSQRQRPHMHDKVLNLFQDLVFIQSGTLEQGDLARLGLGIQAAQHWTREQYPVIQGKTEKVNIGLSEIRATALTVIDDLKSDKPGQLRVVKVADKDTAEVDDIVTFTIRYDNLGLREVTSVRIVDNLTPRLEYVDDSATSDRAGKLVVQDNGEGSLVLIWEFDDALPEHTGGTVTFQARVR